MNTNPNAKRILFFGDSNTWGYMPGTSHNRYLSTERYTGIVQETLGSEYEIIEEGLNSRAIVNGDPRPGKEGRSAMDYILPCLDTHDPLDIICVLLGTNELKAEFNNSAEQIGEFMEKLLNIIISKKSQFRDIEPKIILITPPLVNDETDYCKQGDKYLGAKEKSLKLAEIYKSLAEKLNINFLDITAGAETGVDGIHMTLKGHYHTGRQISDFIKNLEIS